MSVDLVVKYKAAVSKRLEEKTSWGRVVLGEVLEEELVSLVEGQQKQPLSSEEFRESLVSRAVTGHSADLILRIYEEALAKPKELL